MVEYKTGNILQEDAEALVNTVNCVGIMGRGIARQFKTAFPENFKSYAIACKRDEVKPGHMFIYETGMITNPRYIINFPTKRHWRGKSRMEDIVSGLAALVQEIQVRQIRSIAIPPLGSGLGGLDWSQVRPLIEAALKQVSDINVIVFEPAGVPQGALINCSSDVPKMTPGRASLIGLMHRYLDGLLDPLITLLEVHKLMYFMQEAGEPLSLKYSKGPYGPYAENLRHVLKAIDGHLVSGYVDGDEPAMQLQLIPGALEDASAFLKDKVETQSHLERVSRLVDGFESPFGLELLATVHWIATREHVQSRSDVMEHTYRWSKRKKQFSPRQINIAVDVLTDSGWITTPSG